MGFYFCCDLSLSQWGGGKQRQSTCRQLLDSGLATAYDAGAYDAGAYDTGTCADKRVGNAEGLQLIAANCLKF